MMVAKMDSNFTLYSKGIESLKGAISKAMVRNENVATAAEHEMPPSLGAPNEDSSIESSDISNQFHFKTNRRRIVSITDSESDFPHSFKKSRAESPNAIASYVGTLAQPDDASFLNPLHVFVRKQIEVFTATEKEISQPAPGRKVAIRLQQVGLRCIHCKTMPSKSRVKRSTCYPSSVGRVYHSVSDMKFDHFPLCKGFPYELRMEFDSLKADSRKPGKETQVYGRSSTSQYYHDSARRMGMEDRNDGIELQERSSYPTESPSTLDKDTRASFLKTKNQREELFHPDSEGLSEQAINSTFHDMRLLSQLQVPMIFHTNILNYKVSLPIKLNLANDDGKKVVPDEKEPPTLSDQQTAVSLATSMDKDFLNPLHCFVRRNVEFFVATNKDVNAPSPGRKVRVDIGQVGIRCIHCAKSPKKNRIKRAVCYPPSISGIYHCISNMKFDHFGSCINLPDQLRAEFSNLRSNFNRRNSNLGQNGLQTVACSTAQYYHDSAIRLGLRDSSCGIRYAAHNADAEEHVKRECSFDGIAALMLAAGNPYHQAAITEKTKTGITI
jgi:hypothetical protein